MRHTLALLLLSLLFLGCPTAGDDDDSSLSDDDDDDEDSWTTLRDGLDIRDLVVGEGDLVEEDDVITAHYTLWLWEDDALGNQIETSRPDNAFTAALSIGSLIPGWVYGIPGMRVGGVRELIIASDLAYGDNEAGGGTIPGGSTLFFEVEIVGVQ